jgi:carbon monoxide dehydrogenase subunit G
VEMTGEQLIPASQNDTWKALNDPDVLKDCVPGCESIARVTDNEYHVKMVAKIGPVSAKFSGRMSLFDLKPPQSYSLAFEGQGGAAGFAKGAAQVTLSPQGTVGTKLSYNVKANVGGKLAQIGSRLIDAAAKKVADDFFQNFTRKMRAAEDETVVMHADHGLGVVPGHAAKDATLPTVTDTSLVFFAAGALVVFVVALVSLFG